MRSVGVDTKADRRVRVGGGHGLGNGELHAVRRLGLRLEKRTVDYQTVAIDRLAHVPSEN